MATPSFRARFYKLLSTALYIPAKLGAGIILGLSLGLSACGKTGPLYLPDGSAESTITDRIK